MSVTRMVHPAHGAMNAYDFAEQEALKVKGWVVQTAEEFAAALKAKQGSRLDALKAELATLEAAPVAVKKAKPGRKAKAAA